MVFQVIFANATQTESPWVGLPRTSKMRIQYPALQFSMKKDGEDERDTSSDIYLESVQNIRRNSMRRCQTYVRGLIKLLNFYPDCCATTPVEAAVSVELFIEGKFDELHWFRDAWHCFNSLWSTDGSGGRWNGIDNIMFPYSPILQLASKHDKLFTFSVRVTWRHRYWIPLLAN